MTMQNVNLNKICEDNWDVVAVKVDGRNSNFTSCLHCGSALRQGILIRNRQNPLSAFFYDQPCIKSEFDPVFKSKLLKLIKNFADLRYTHARYGIRYFRGNMNPIKVAVMSKIFDEKIVNEYNNILIKKLHKKESASHVESSNYILNVEKQVFKEITLGSIHWTERFKETNKSLIVEADKFCVPSPTFQGTNHTQVSKNTALDSETLDDETDEEWINEVLNAGSSQETDSAEPSSTFQAFPIHSDYITTSFDPISMSLDLLTLDPFIFPPEDDNIDKILPQEKNLISTVYQDATLDIQSPPQRVGVLRYHPYPTSYTQEGKNNRRAARLDVISSSIASFDKKAWRVVGLKIQDVNKNFPSCDKCKSEKGSGYLFENKIDNSRQFYHGWCAQSFINRKTQQTFSFFKQYSKKKDKINEMFFLKTLPKRILEDFSCLLSDDDMLNLLYVNMNNLDERIHVVHIIEKVFEIFANPQAEGPKIALDDF